MSHPHKPWGKALMDFFASLRLTIFLLIILSLTSILGTVIPQGETPHEYLHNSSQAKIKLFQALDLFDMYHSWWFIGILALFTINLIVCSAKRLPHVWRFVSRPATVADEQTLSGLSNRVDLPIKGFFVQPEKLQNLLAEKFGKAVVTKADGAIHLFAERCAVSRLAVYVTHLSIIVIFIGSIIGSVWGYKGFVTITEGDMISSVRTRSGDIVKLDFSLRCDDFSVSYYPTGAPKEFKSILTVVDKNGVPVAGHANVPVIVNDPLQYAGLTFYQSSYGKTGDHSFSVRGADGRTAEYILVPTQGAKRLSDGTVLRVTESTTDVSQFIPGKSGAAAQVELTSAGGGPTQSTIIYANHPEENMRTAMQTGGSVLTYNGLVGEKEYTGLQVTKDPGVWVVWIGCILMMVGIYGAFLMSHRRIWIRITDDEIVIAGHANKNQMAFSFVFDRLVEAVRKEISPEVQR